MPTDSIKKLRKMKTPQERLTAMSKRKSRAVKLGDTTEYYFYVDPEEIRMKSGGVGTIMSKNKTVVQPGEALSFSVPYQLVDFNKMAFHPAADQPSTSVFPHPTFVPNILDPDIKIVKGIYSILKALTEI